MKHGSFFFCSSTLTCAFVSVSTPAPASACACTCACGGSARGGGRFVKAAGSLEAVYLLAEVGLSSTEVG